MDHTVHAAEIDERTVVREALDGSLEDHTLFAGVPELLLLCLALLACDDADGAVCAAAVLADLDDLDALGRPDENGEIALTRDAGLRRGDEHAVLKDADDDAALDRLGHLALEDLARLVSRGDVLPVLVAVDALLRERRDAVNVGDLDDEHVEFIADLEQLVELGVRVVGDLFLRYHAGRLRPEVHVDLVRKDRTHYAVYHVS